MKMKLERFLFFVLLLFVMVSGQNFHTLSDEFINEINSKQSLWKAGRNFRADTPLSYIKNLMGAIRDSNLQRNLDVMKHSPELIASLPENFDPRDKWSNCPTLNEIRDQGSCGSCWVFGAVEAMTDRVCIYSNGTQNFHFSAEDVLSCSSYGSCEGGFSSYAWDFWVKNGIVSGGAYNSKEGCRPYEIPPCDHYNTSSTLPPCPVDYDPTPTCVNICVAGSNIDYKTDKRYGKRTYRIDQSEDEIKAELYTNGPVEACFYAYDDFLHYKSGVYKYIAGDLLSGHCIKILGWGVENGTKYWLAANSWNSSWGDKGFFKILRGKNECNIESGIVAGEPLLDHNLNTVS